MKSAFSKTIYVVSLLLVVSAIVPIAWFYVRSQEATKPLSAAIQTLGDKQGSELLDAGLKKAALLFHEKNYGEMHPILEELVRANPSDDQAVFGLGVALIYIAHRGTNPDHYHDHVVQARKLLTKAKELGAEDNLLNWHLKGLLSENDNEISKEVETLASLWAMHPPKIFDTPPPHGIELPSGYRHKSSIDFEGGRSGIIWKYDGLKINYEFAYWAGGGNAVKRVREKIWTKEFWANNLKFECALETEKSLKVSAYRLPPDPVPFADFFVTLKTEQDVEEAIAIIKGLKPNKD